MVERQLRGAPSRLNMNCFGLGLGLGLGLDRGWCNAASPARQRVRTPRILSTPRLTGQNVIQMRRLTDDESVARQDYGRKRQS